MKKIAGFGLVLFLALLAMQPFLEFFESLSRNEEIAGYIFRGLSIVTMAVIIMAIYKLLFSPK